MKRLFLLLILSVVPILALAQSDNTPPPGAEMNNNSLAQTYTQASLNDQPDGAGSCVVLTPASYDFGDVPVDFSSAPATFFLVNNGCGVDVIVTAITATGDAFTQTNKCVGRPLQNNDACPIYVTFTPEGTGSRHQQLIVNDHLQGSDQQLQQTAGLSGSGIADVKVSPTSCNFGQVPRGNTAYCSVTIQNEEPVRLTIENCHAGPSPTFTQDTSCPMSLAKKGDNGDSVSIQLAFTPPGIGLYTGQFIVTTNSRDGSPNPVPLTGIGTWVCHPPICCNGSGPGCPPQ